MTGETSEIYSKNYVTLNFQFCVISVTETYQFLFQLRKKCVNSAFDQFNIFSWHTCRDFIKSKCKGLHILCSSLFPLMLIFAVIAMGYRVNSIKATHFRIWANNTLREFIVKGFALNDQMLKNGRVFGKDYFDELLEKIREIQASERRAYQKIPMSSKSVAAIIKAKLKKF